MQFRIVSNAEERLMNVKLTASAERRTWESSCAPFVYHNTDKELFLLAIMSIMCRLVYG